MKNLILIFLIFFMGCNKDDSNNEPQPILEDTLIGTWQLVELYLVEDGPLEWGPVNNGYTYTFREDNSVSWSFFPCDGVYEVFGDIIEVTFDCPENQSFMRTHYSFENRFLLFTPNPEICNESGPCIFKFQKIASN